MSQLVSRTTLFPYTTLFRSRNSARVCLRQTGQKNKNKCRERPERRVWRICSCFQSIAAYQFYHGMALDWKRSEEYTSELQSPCNLVCRLLIEKKNIDRATII